MTAQGQAGRRADGWISVETRMPEPGQEVAARCGKSGERTAVFTGDGWDVHYTGRDFFGLPVQDYGHPVTHWMPIPDPPVADGQEEGDE